MQKLTLPAAPARALEFPEVVARFHRVAPKCVPFVSSIMPSRRQPLGAQRLLVSYMPLARSARLGQLKTSRSYARLLKASLSIYASLILLLGHSSGGWRRVASQFLGAHSTQL